MPARALDPLEHGVRGDGTTDDTAAWQQILESCRRTGQRGILLPQMTSVISKPLDVSGISLLGIGGIASTFRASRDFAGESMMLLDGETPGGAANQSYSGFRLVGVRGTRAKVHAIVMRGDVLGNTFLNLRIQEFSGNGIVLAGNRSRATAWPAVNTFLSCYVKDGDGHAWVMRSGRNNKFISCVGEVVNGRCWSLSNEDGGLARTELDSCWAELAGEGHTAVYVNGDDIHIRRMEINGYGAPDGSGGHGIHITGTSARCVVEGGDVSFNRSGKSTPRSVKIRVDAGSRHVLRSLPGNITRDDLSITQLDTALENINAAGLGSYMQVHASNAHAVIGRGATRYVQPGTGWDSASQVDARMRVSGRCLLVGLWAEATPPAEGSYVVTVYKNGSPTVPPMRVTLSSANRGVASNTTNEVGLEDGDCYSFQVSLTGGAPPIARGALHITVGQRL